MPDELAIIERFFRPLAGEGAFRLLDDAGLLTAPPDSDIVVTNDMLSANVHFLPGDPPDTIARKAIRVNISDLTAKGARPLGYLLGLGVAPDTSEAWLTAFAEGLRDDQARYRITLLGGDTISVSAGPTISISAFGAVPKGRMVHRFGGSSGDALYVSGTIGESAVGLALLKKRPGPWDELPPARRDQFVQRFRVPEPRVALAPVLADYAAATIDISDGLVGDCDKVAGYSRCSAVIEAESVPLPAGIAGLQDAQMLEWLLTSGDDYEILAAIPRENEAGFRRAAQGAGVAIARIGQLTPGSALTEVRLGGKPLAISKRAYVHGRIEWTE
jgi:thiamine-monophosphate kinase